MTGFVAANAGVVSRGREPVNVSLRDPASGYYLPPASDCVFHDLPGFVDVIPIQRPRLPQDTKHICDVCVLFRELHIAGTLRRRLRDRNSATHHHGGGPGPRTRLSRARDGYNAHRPVGCGVPAPEIHRPKTLISRSGDSVDALYQRFGCAMVELAICILKRRGLKVVPVRPVLRYERVTSPEQLTQSLQIELMAFEPGFPRHGPNLATSHQYRCPSPPVGLYDWTAIAREYINAMAEVVHRRPQHPRRPLQTI